MSQHEPTPQPPYSFGRDRHYDAGHQHGVGYPGHHPGPVSHSPQPHGPGHYSPAQHGPGVPPPPAGHRGMFTVVILYFVTGFMLVFTGAGVGVTLEAVTGEDGADLLVNVFMLVASLAITAGLAAWLIRIHRRRATYQRILDEHYAQQFGHYPGH